MAEETLSAALEREHHEIDAGLDAFTAGLSTGESRVESLTTAINALRRHIYLEEEILFPSLRQAEPGLMGPIFVMLREHGLMWKVLDEIEADVKQDPGSASLPGAMQKLAGLIEEHNGKEEVILYPQADTVLVPAATTVLAEFMASGKMPEGWVCSGARPGKA